MIERSVLFDCPKIGLIRDTCVVDNLKWSFKEIKRSRTIKSKVLKIIKENLKGDKIRG